MIAGEECPKTDYYLYTPCLYIINVAIDQVLGPWKTVNYLYQDKMTILRKFYCHFLAGEKSGLARISHR